MINEGAYFALLFYRFNLGLTSLCFVDDLCQILECFHLIHWLRNKVRVLLHSGGKYKLTDVCGYNVLKSSCKVKDLKQYFNR